MILVRPITPYIATLPYIINKRIPQQEIITRIDQGYPVAQTYGLGAPWTNDNHRHFKRGKICGENSPCLLPTQPYGELHYSVGPPYVVHKQDFLRIAESWTRLVPRVYEDYPYLLAEMYAYSMAAAHEKLPHLQVDHYMVSNVEAGGEGWPWVDQLTEVCLPPNEDGEYYPNLPIPTVVHFCQTFRAGDYAFTKRRVPKNIFSCEHELLKEPPMDLGKNVYFKKKEEVSIDLMSLPYLFIFLLLFFIIFFPH
jgi:peptidyl serine alpha-galactosyltransferase